MATPTVRLSPSTLRRELRRRGLTLKALSASIGMTGRTMSQAHLGRPISIPTHRALVDGLASVPLLATGECALPPSLLAEDDPDLLPRAS